MNAKIMCRFHSVTTATRAADTSNSHREDARQDAVQICAARFSLASIHSVPAF